MKALRIATALAFLVSTLFWTPVFASSWDSSKTSAPATPSEKGAVMESPRASEETPMKAPEKNGETALMESGFRAHQFLGEIAKNPQGENLGKVRDFVFDQSGRIEYVILSYRTDGSEKLIPIPFDVIKPAPGSVALTIDISRDRLTNAPALAEWKDFDNPEWTKEVHSYYEAAEFKAPARSSESAIDLPPYTEGCSSKRMEHQGAKMGHQGMESQRTEPSQTEPQGGYQY